MCACIHPMEVEVAGNGLFKLLGEVISGTRKWMSDC